MANQYSAGTDSWDARVPRVAGSHCRHYGRRAVPMSLDHSQGKWFVSGEPLPQGFVVSPHPEGHTVPLQHHAMSDLARNAQLPSSASHAAFTSRPSASFERRKKKRSLCCPRSVHSLAFPERTVSSMVSPPSQRDGPCSNDFGALRLWPTPKRFALAKVAPTES